MSARGWYPTPSDAAWQQFWDGSKFTGELQPAPGVRMPGPGMQLPAPDPPRLTSAVQPPAAAAPPPRPARSAIGPALVMVAALAVSALILTQLVGGKSSKTPDRQPADGVSAVVRSVDTAGAPAPVLVRPAPASTSSVQAPTQASLPSITFPTFPTPFGLPTPPHVTAVGGGGVVVMCQDGSASHAGGKQGACSYHGGKR